MPPIHAYAASETKGRIAATAEGRKPDARLCSPPSPVSGKRAAGTRRRRSPLYDGESRRKPEKTPLSSPEAISASGLLRLSKSSKNNISTRCGSPKGEPDASPERQGAYPALSRASRSSRSLAFRRVGR